jgi:hypothetical protein
MHSALTAKIPGVLSTSQSISHHLRHRDLGIVVHRASKDFMDVIPVITSRVRTRRTSRYHSRAVVGIGNVTVTGVEATVVEMFSPGKDWLEGLLRPTTSSGILTRREPSLS